MAPRQFSLKEANNLIPQLSLLIEQLRVANQELDRLQVQLNDLARKAAGNGHGLEGRVESVREDALRITTDLNGLIQRVNETGCELKGIDQGLIDFRSLRSGREVYLCWQMGEQTVEWWHELESGFSSRQPL